MAESLNTSTHERYLADLGKAPANGAPDFLLRLRAQGAALFRETEFPNTRMEEWRQTNLGSVVSTPFQAITREAAGQPPAAAVAQACYAPGEWHTVVFVDGYHAPGLSSSMALPGGVIAGSLYAEAKGEAASVVERHLGTVLGARNAYTALNTAALCDGAFLYVPKGVALETPVQFVFVSTAATEYGAAHLRNLLVLDASAEAQVVLTHVGLGDARYLSNVVEEVVLGENAQLSAYTLVEEGAQGAHLATTEVRHARDSRFHAFTFSLSGGVVRNQLCTTLAGENAECALHGLYLNDGQRLVDNCLLITHVEPNCRSRIAYKGVLDGQSNSVFTGKVYVHPEAQKTDSDQLSQNLLLSDTATVDTKPQLEIFADDVKCTHGATVGSPPEEVIFYFRSRGIDEATARGMLTYGFADEIVSEIGLEPIRERLDRFVYEKYSPKF